MAYSMDGTRPVYIHQINKLRNARTGDLFQAMESDCLSLYKELGLELFACWESAPGQGIGPEMVEIWELPNFDAYTKFAAAAHAGKGDSRLRKWFERKSDWVESSDSMLCFSHPKSPTVADLRKSGVKAKLVIHEMVHTEPSRQLDYLEAIHKMWWPVAEAGGRSLLGLFWSPWNNRRAINIWGVSESWDDLSIMKLGKNDAYQSDALFLWMNMGLALRDDWLDRFMVPAPFSTVN